MQLSLSGHCGVAPQRTSSRADLLGNQIDFVTSRVIVGGAIFDVDFLNRGHPTFLKLTSIETVPCQEVDRQLLEASVRQGVAAEFGLTCLGEGRE